MHCVDCERRLLRDQDREKDYNNRRRRCGPTSGEEYDKNSAKLALYALSHQAQEGNVKGS